MPAQSQQQQKLFGLALAFKRGEVPASEVSDEIKAIADRMSEKEIEDFASTKHKGLPKMKEQLRKIVREIMREKVISEMNDESINEGKKVFRVNPQIGKVKYSISSHDGVKKHKDGSDFFDIETFKNKVDLEKAIKNYTSKGFKMESVNEAKSYSNKFASWFTGTVLCNVKHPRYGNHKVTPDQIKYSSGDYKMKLFKNIEQAVKRGDITPAMIKQNESVNEESINEGPSTEEKRIAMLAVRKQAKYRSVSLEQAIQDQINALEDLQRDIKRGKTIK